MSRSEIQVLLAENPWLGEEGLEVCLVGSWALYLACGRAGLPLPPEPSDLDLAWKLDPGEGRRLLEEKGLPCEATPGSQARGTLATKLSGRRIEITTYRGGGATGQERRNRDAHHRDMTIGALYHRLWNDGTEDPLGGLEDWSMGRIKACGLAAERIREHPIRALRYIRRAVELGFHLESATRRAIRASAPHLGKSILPEALAEEIRRVLKNCASPGVFFQICHEEHVLPAVIPELAPLFDGRPAGRIRHHPEITLALHMVLALKEAATICRESGGEDREAWLRLMLPVLCHDLGKGRTPGKHLPSHPGHETGGVKVIKQLFGRLPALGGRYIRKLCKVAARTHLLLGNLRVFKPGTLVDLWEADLHPCRDDYGILAQVFRCDRAGRLPRQTLGLPLPPQKSPSPGGKEAEKRVRDDLLQLEGILGSVSGEESARLFPDDPSALNQHLRDRRIEALLGSRFLLASTRT